MNISKNTIILSRKDFNDRLRFKNGIPCNASESYIGDTKNFLSADLVLYMSSKKTVILKNRFGDRTKPQPKKVKNPRYVKWSYDKKGNKVFVFGTTGVELLATPEQTKWLIEISKKWN